MDEGESESILRQLEDAPLQRELRPGVMVDLELPDEYDSDALKAQVIDNVQSAVRKHEETVGPSLTSSFSFLDLS